MSEGFGRSALQFVVAFLIARQRITTNCTMSVLARKEKLEPEPRRVGVRGSAGGRDGESGSGSPTFSQSETGLPLPSYYYLDFDGPPRYAATSALAVLETDDFNRMLAPRGI